MAWMEASEQLGRSDSLSVTWRLLVPIYTGASGSVSGQLSSGGRSKAGTRLCCWHPIHPLGGASHTGRPLQGPRFMVIEALFKGSVQTKIGVQKNQEHTKPTRMLLLYVLLPDQWGTCTYVLWAPLF